MELRCTNKLHAVLREAEYVEVKCDSRFCGHRPGVVVLHRFDVHTGQLIETKRYQDPTTKERRASSGPGNERTSVRSA